MPKRMSIYVNDDLIERIKPFTGSFNISAAACKGIEAEVSRLEAKARRLETMPIDELREYTKSLLRGEGRTK